MKAATCRVDDSEEFRFVHVHFKLLSRILR